MILVGFTILILLYCLFIIYLWLGWERISVIPTEEHIESIAILIPVRNEEDNIKDLLSDLVNQSYRGEIEIIVIDDHSEDTTVELVKEVADKHSNVKLICLNNTYGKKAALTAGVKEAKAEILLTTDGDCRVFHRWAESMANSFGVSTQFVSGPVKIKKGGDLLSSLQSVEFTSLIGSGAAFIGWGMPVMANGANMGFRRSVFLKIAGFEGNHETASGDDVFLLHKIARENPKSIAFVKDERAIVQTKAQPTLKAFIQQRIRWASKWRAYKDMFTKLTAVLVFIISLTFVILPILVVFKKITLFVWLNLFIIKLFFDFFFIRQFSKFFDEKLNLVSFILLQLFYPFYVVTTAFFSFQKTYYWKGRKVK